MMTTNTDSKLDAILEAIKRLEARVTHIESMAAVCASARLQPNRSVQEVVNQRVSH